MSEFYAGDITPQQAWDMLEKQENTFLVDVRTQAEWAWVGQVDLSPLEKQPITVEWTLFPDGMPNGDFCWVISPCILKTKTPPYCYCAALVCALNMPP